MVFNVGPMKFDWNCDFKAFFGEDVEWETCSELEFILNFEFVR